MRNHRESAPIFTALFLIFGMGAFAQPASRDAVARENEPPYKGK
jgi:hypothetical protein